MRQTLLFRCRVSRRKASDGAVGCTSKDAIVPYRETMKHSSLVPFIYTLSKCRITRNNNNNSNRSTTLFSRSRPKYQPKSIRKHQINRVVAFFCKLELELKNLGWKIHNNSILKSAKYYHKIPSKPRLVKKWWNSYAQVVSHRFMSSSRISFRTVSIFETHFFSPVA